MVPYNVYGFLLLIRRTQKEQETQRCQKGYVRCVHTVQIVYMGINYLRNKSWKPECVLNFNMGWRVLVFYPERELDQKRSKSGNFQNLKVFIFHPILKCIFFCEMFIFMGYWWVNKRNCYFILQRGLIEAQIPKFCIFERYIEFLFFSQIWCGFFLTSV